MRSDKAAGAPERITVDWDEKPRSSKIGTAWESDLGDHEYILATPTALAASPEVQKLVARAILAAQLRAFERGRIDTPDEIRAEAAAILETKP